MGFGVSVSKIDSEVWRLNHECTKYKNVNRKLIV